MHNPVIDSFRIVAALYPPLLSMFSRAVEGERQWWADGVFFKMPGHSDLGGPSQPPQFSLSHTFASPQQLRFGKRMSAALL